MTRGITETETNMKTLYRAVGFTDSTHTDGSPEVGWKGDFFLSREEAEEAGCGVSEAWHSGEEVRCYTVDDDGDVTVDGEQASHSTATEFLQAAELLAIEK